MKISGVLQKRILFLFFSLFSISLFAQEISSDQNALEEKESQNPANVEEEKITKISFWESGIKFNIDTANIRLGELPKIARAIYFSTGYSNFFSNDFIYRWNLGAGYCTYAGYVGFFTACVSAGTRIFDWKNIEINALFSVDFQTYCYKVPFWAFGPDLYITIPLTDTLGFYLDLGPRYNFSFKSLLLTTSMGLTIRSRI